MTHYKAPNNSLHFLDSTEYESLLPSGSVAITDAEAEALRPLYTPTYAEKRAAEYPSIPDQLDTLYHGGIDAWKAEIKTVKDKYPKP